MVVYPPKLIFMLTFLFLFTHFFHFSHSVDLPLPYVKLQPSDRNVLLRIQKHFGGPESGFWNSSDTKCCVDCTYEAAVRCNNNGHVISLDLHSGPNLFGSIPPAVADLIFLQQLSFSGQGFTGRIPSSIGRLKNLEYLSIGKTNVTGSIPPTLGQLKNLASLELSQNKLFGPIPDSLGQLTKVTELDLSSNRLSGPIPNSLCQLTRISIMDLSENRLSGSIPDCLGSFKNLLRLLLSQNQFNGSIPKLPDPNTYEIFDVSSNKLTDVSNLFVPHRKVGPSIVNISNNMLKFDLSKIVLWDQITELWMSHNKIYGSLPKQLNELPEIAYLDVSYNQLCGPIPRDLTLISLGAKYFEHNKCLCGSPLPPCK